MDWETITLMKNWNIFVLSPARNGTLAQVDGVIRLATLWVSNTIEAGTVRVANPSGPSDGHDDHLKFNYCSLDFMRNRKHLTWSRIAALLTSRLI